MTFDDRVQSLVVILDLIRGEVFYYHCQQHHCELFIDEGLRVAISEEELEKLVPFLVRYQDLPQGPDNVCNVFLDDSDGFL